MRENDPDDRYSDYPDVSLHGDEPVECPSCGQPSGSIKCYNTLILLFIWFFVVWWPKKDVGCPSCIRGKIAQFCLINIVTANILWPIIILPWSLVLFCMSFSQGHSSEIQAILRDTRRGEW